MNKNVKILEVTNQISEEAASAQRLYEIRSIIKELQKEEKTLKQMFIDMPSSSFDAGDFLVTVVDGHRESLDQKSLIKEFGNQVKKFMRTTHYLKVQVSRK